jgi:hypothetical protein
MSKKTILNDQELTGGEGTAVDVSMAFFREYTALAMSHSLSRVNGCAPCLNMNIGKDDSSILISTRGNVFLNGTILSLDLKVQRVEACTVSELDIAKEVSGLGLKVPLVKNLINFVKFGLANIEGASSSYVFEIRSEERWHILFQVVNGLSHSINQILS